MTRFVVALALTGWLLSAVNDLVTFLDSLREPGPALANAITMVLKVTAPPDRCGEVDHR